MTTDQQDLIQSVEDAPIEAKAIVARPVERELSATDQLIRIALEGNVDMSKLEKLIELKNREEDRSAALAFDKKFASMQKALPVIKKGKQVKDDLGNVMYTYAPLEAIQRDCDPVVAKYGFSYRWREETTEKGKRVTIRISGHGHFEESTFDVPQVTANKWSNAVQTMGSMTTYGHRYTYIAGFGITVEGVDDDALGFDVGVQYAEYFKALDSENNKDAMYQLVRNYVAELRNVGDNEGSEIIKRYYTKRKKEMS